MHGVAQAVENLGAKGGVTGSRPPGLIPFLQASFSV